MNDLRTICTRGDGWFSMRGLSWLGVVLLCAANCQSVDVARGADNASASNVIEKRPLQTEREPSDPQIAAERHWAFQPVRKPALPRLQNESWIQSPIDMFVASRLAKAGLVPSPPADRRTLIRRLSFDLVGLPPTAAEVDAFVSDNAEDAYQRLVDRLLASPHYGEKWGRHWLDLARYSDTKGYVYAREERFWVHAWSYRDWVVRALNSDMPFDRFVLLQMAADQLADEDPRSLAAMGFLTLGRRFLGVTHDIIDDRIDVVTRGLLGLSVCCARCHDHKFDPIPTRDYYSLYGVFKNCSERVVPIAEGDQLDSRGEVVEKSGSQNAETPTRKTPTPNPSSSAADLRPENGGGGLEVGNRSDQDGGGGLEVGNRSDEDEGGGSEVGSKFAQELTAREKKLHEAMEKYRTEAADRVRNRVADYLTAQLELEKYPEEGFDQILAKDDIFPAFVRRFRDYLAAADQRGDRVFAAWLAFARLNQKSFAGESSRVCQELNEAAASDVHPLVAREFADPPANMRDVARRYGELLKKVDSEWQTPVTDRVSVDGASADGAGENPPLSDRPSDVDTESIWQVLHSPHSPCTVPNEPIVNIDQFFPTKVCETLWKLQGEVDRLLVQTPEATAHAVILVDRADPANARVLRRGNPADLGEEVPRQFLEVLTGPDREPFHHGSGRLEFARAIVDPRNPLTARVIVNRVWMHHFGSGLVTTPSDFGLRAEPPSHPALLDWLASQFVSNRWSLKWLHRQIVLSATYRQSSVGPEDSMQLTRAQQIDPDNRLLWRTNGRRLSFEQFRDALLAVTGELDLHLGGKPVKLFSTPRVRRRTLYGLVDRQFLPGTLRVFDFANPDLHTPRRSETTVPQQALFFLNHPLVVESARLVARRVELIENATSEAKVRQMYRLLYQRSPTDRQIELAAALLVAAKAEQMSEPIPAPADWSYGYGEYNEKQRSVVGFQSLPHFTGKAWQGGPSWPDAKLGWVQLTAEGGHPGNDRSHAAIRRWTAPSDTVVRLKSTLVHDPEAGDGVRGFVVSSRLGLLQSAVPHHDRATIDVPTIKVEAGDTLDFVVDIGSVLNHDEFTWKIVLTDLSPPDKISETPTAWNARKQFGGVPTAKLDPWEQLAQALLATNEFMFID